MRCASSKPPFAFEDDKEEQGEDNDISVEAIKPPVVPKPG